MYFESPGAQNTEQTLKIALQTCQERGIKHLVVASTTGATAKKALELVKKSEVRLVVVRESASLMTGSVQK